MAHSSNGNDDKEDVRFPIFPTQFKAQTDRTLTGKTAANGARFNPVFADEDINDEQPGISTQQLSFASSSSYVSVRLIDQQRPMKSFRSSRSSANTYMSINIYQEDPYTPLSYITDNPYTAYIKDRSYSSYLKALALIICCLLIGTAVILVFILINDNKKSFQEGCKPANTTHFDSNFISKCAYKYTTISNVDVIQLRTQYGNPINFTNPYRSDSEETQIIERDTSRSTYKNWRLEHKLIDNETVEFYFMNNVSDCKMMGSHEVMLLSGGTETPGKSTFDVKIADDFKTKSFITAYVDDDKRVPAVEMHCEGVLYCKDFIFYTANKARQNENMFCALNKTISGVVRTTCYRKWTDIELLDNTTLQCVPIVPSNVNDTNNTTQEFPSYEINELCTSQLHAQIGNISHYYCRKRVGTTCKNMKVELWRKDDQILNLIIPPDGTPQKTSKRRNTIEGHIERDILVMNLTFTDVYLCDGGLYKIKITNASDIQFELNVSDPTSFDTCHQDTFLIEWQQEMKYSCHFCSENDVQLIYMKDDIRTTSIPSTRVNVTKRFENWMIQLHITITNMTCETEFHIYVVGKTNRTISLKAEAIPFLGNVDQTFLNQSIGENKTMYFRHFLGCSAKNIISEVYGSTVIQYSSNVTISKHYGIIVENLVEYFVISDSLVTSIANYTDNDLKDRLSEDSFTIYQLEDDFCSLKESSNCNYEHPKFKDRYVACISNMSKPIELHCVKDQEWHDPLNDCRGLCE